MQNYEFMSYKQYPDDQYTSASCKVRVDRKYVFTFVQKKTKDGGLFWASPSAQVSDGGEKKYLPAHMLDSQLESEIIIDFIKDSVKRVTSPLAAQMSSSVQYSSPMPPSKVGVAEQEQLPF